MISAQQVERHEFRPIVVRLMHLYEEQNARAAKANPAERTPVTVDSW